MGSMDGDRPLSYLLIQGVNKTLGDWRNGSSRQALQENQMQGKVQNYVSRKAGFDCRLEPSLFPSDAGRR